MRRTRYHALRSADELRRTTAPALLLERARTHARGGRLPRQEARHLPRDGPGRSMPTAWRAPPRALRRSGSKRRRPHRHHGGRLRGVADLRPRRPVARRHRLRHLSDRLGGGGRIPDARRRRGPVHRRGPGVRRQDPAASPTGCRQLRRIVVVDDTALFAFAPRQARHLCETCARPAHDADLAWLEARGRQAAARSSRRSSSTPRARPGHPKGALVTHGKHLAATRSVAAHYPTLTEKAHRTVAYLPLCHVLGRDIAVTLPLMTRARAPHRRERRGPAGDAVRDGADGAVHGAALSAEAAPPQILVGRPAARRPQALRLRARHGLCARARQAALGGHGERATVGLRACVVARSSCSGPILNKIGFDQLELVVSRRRAAAGRDHGGVAHAGRQCRARCTARPRRPAASSPASAGRSRGRATSARCRRASR